MYPKVTRQERIDYRNRWAAATDVPYGYCWCGCGEKTPISTKTRREHGWLIGEPHYFIQHHHQKTLCGEKSSQWKGGRTLHPDGYWMVRAPDGHPFAYSNGYILEHRLIMEDHLNRFLWPWEDIHHENENRTDNRLENLRLLSTSEHIRLHQPQRKKNG